MTIELDIPCDVQARDRDGHLWSFLHEAAHPASVRIGEFVVTGDDDDPVVAKVLEIIERPGGQKVVMELVGDAEDLLSALARARLTAV